MGHDAVEAMSTMGQRSHNTGRAQRDGLRFQLAGQSKDQRMISPAAEYLAAALCQASGRDFRLRAASLFISARSWTCMVDARPRRRWPNHNNPAGVKLPLICASIINAELALMQSNPNAIKYLIVMLCYSINPATLIFVLPRPPTT
jgi:hypothetical protein